VLTDAPFCATTSDGGERCGRGALWLYWGAQRDARPAHTWVNHAHVHEGTLLRREVVGAAATEPELRLVVAVVAVVVPPLVVAAARPAGRVGSHHCVTVEMKVFSRQGARPAAETGLLSVMWRKAMAALNPRGDAAPRAGRQTPWTSRRSLPACAGLRLASAKLRRPPQRQPRPPRTPRPMKAMKRSSPRPTTLWHSWLAAAAAPGRARVHQGQGGVAAGVPASTATLTALGAPRQRRPLGPPSPPQRPRLPRRPQRPPALRRPRQHRLPLVLLQLRVLDLVAQERTPRRGRYAPCRAGRLSRKPSPALGFTFTLPPLRRRLYLLYLSRIWRQSFRPGLKEVTWMWRQPRSAARRTPAPPPSTSKPSMPRASRSMASGAMRSPWFAACRPANASGFCTRGTGCQQPPGTTRSAAQPDLAVLAHARALHGHATRSPTALALRQRL